MFNRSKQCLPLIMTSKGRMHDTSPAHPAYTQPDQDSDSREVSPDEIVRAVQGVDPDNSLSRVERVEQGALRHDFWVNHTHSLQEGLSLQVERVQEILADQVSLQV